MCFCKSFCMHKWSRRLGDSAFGSCGRYRQKLILRHPHVFGDVQVSGQEVLQNWDAIKKATKSQKHRRRSYAAVSSALPALMRSEKIQKKAAKAGYDFSSVSRQWKKVAEELREVREAKERGSREDCRGKWAICFFGGECGPDVRLTRKRRCRFRAKFIGRFARAEQLSSTGTSSCLPKKSVNAFGKRLKPRKG